MCLFCVLVPSVVYLSVRCQASVVCRLSSSMLTCTLFTRARLSLVVRLRIMILVRAVLHYAMLLLLGQPPTATGVCCVHGKLLHDLHSWWCRWLSLTGRIHSLGHPPRALRHWHLLHPGSSPRQRLLYVSRTVECITACTVQYARTGGGGSLMRDGVGLQNDRHNASCMTEEDGYEYSYTPSERLRVRVHTLGLYWCGGGGGGGNKPSVFTTS